MVPSTMIFSVSLLKSEMFFANPIEVLLLISEQNPIVAHMARTAVTIIFMVCLVFKFFECEIFVLLFQSLSIFGIKLSSKIIFSWFFSIHSLAQFISLKLMSLISSLANFVLKSSFIIILTRSFKA